MDVFIGNLHQKVRIDDLKVFLKGLARHATVEIVKKEYQDGSTFRFALASFDKDRHAHKAIKKLHNKPLLGLDAEVREFHHRSSNNERRAIGWRDRPWHADERRGRVDRRRKEVVKRKDDLFEQPPLVEEPSQTGVDSVSIAAYGNLSRKTL